MSRSYKLKLSLWFTFHHQIVLKRMAAKENGFHEQADVRMALSQASPIVWTTRPRCHYSRVFIPRTNAMPIFR